MDLTSQKINVLMQYGWEILQCNTGLLCMVENFSSHQSIALIIVIRVEVYNPGSRRINFNPQ